MRRVEAMGSLAVVPALDRADLLAPPVAAALAAWNGTLDAGSVGVAEIDPELADTAAARRELDVRKASFAATAEAVSATGMEYGGITPIGLPGGWRVLVDGRVAAAARVVVGSGVRRSKLALPGSVLGRLPGAIVIDGLAH